jgi:hypothetical protein
VIAYLERETTFDVREALAALSRRAAALGPRPSVTEARDLLADVGEIEAALVDALRVREDDHEPVGTAVEDAGLQAGRVFGAALAGEDGGAHVEALEAALERLRAAPLPRRAHGHPAEGYAHYGLYPEQYAAAARAFAAAHTGSPHVVCIGLRAAGTSLSAVVAAALETLGLDVERLTVRPRGHPFDRRLSLSERLRFWLAVRAERAHFLVVDEGPGLSGSSFACVARALGELAVSDERIAFLPSFVPDGTRFLSSSARAAWGRHRKYAAGFEDVWPRGRLEAVLQSPRLVNVSGGRWRRLLGAPDLPSHPQQERRKYVLHDAGQRRSRRIARFAGIGRTGRARLDRARRLASEGWGPVPLALRDGFLVLPFLEGHPLREAAPSATLIATAARYLAFVHRELRAERPTAPPELVAEMIAVNAVEAGLTVDASMRDRLHDAARAAADAPLAAVDGRMRPHEWLCTRGGFVKTDALDHHDDHFFPGDADSAWDVAGTLAEFSWTGEAREAFLDAYARASGDQHVRARLPFQLAAYSAFRLGHATLAAQALSGTADGARFETAAAQWRAGLGRRLSASVVDFRGARAVP